MIGFEMQVVGEAMKLGVGMEPEDVLMADKQWLLFRINGTQNFDSWIYHCCNPIAARFTVSRFITWREITCNPITCWKCKQVCPDEISAAWKLHNWDSINIETYTKDLPELNCLFGIAEDALK